MSSDPFRLRQARPTPRKRPDGPPTLFGPEHREAVTGDTAQRHVGVAIAGVMAFVVLLVLVMGWTLSVGR